jgi:hypothetical protein
MPPYSVGGRRSQIGVGARYSHDWATLPGHVRSPVPLSSLVRLGFRRLSPFPPRSVPPALFPRGGWILLGGMLPITLDLRALLLPMMLVSLPPASQPSLPYHRLPSAICCWMFSGEAQPFCSRQCALFPARVSQIAPAPRSVGDPLASPRRSSALTIWFRLSALGRQTPWVFDGSAGCRERTQVFSPWLLFVRKRRRFGCPWQSFFCKVGHWSRFSSAF